MVPEILALCARAASHPLQLRRLEVAFTRFSRWADLAEQSEIHGIAPLIYYHFQAAGFSPPVPARRVLKALVMRHRDANAIRSRALVLILDALSAEGIPVLVLKGAALAHTVYPEPGLRPMRDIDLLVPPSQARQAQSLLISLGYHESSPTGFPHLAHHHLPPVSQVVGGLTVSVELHHRLLLHGRSSDFESLWSTKLCFDLDGREAFTLAPVETLWHIYRHSFGFPLISEPMRLIWVADFVSVVEKYLEQIDWPDLQRCYPQLWNILPLFHSLTPWSERVQERLQLELDPVPQGAGELFQGWPVSSLAVQRASKGWFGTLRDTFWPSAWWLRLYYGLDGRGTAWWWHRTLRHPLHILSWVGRWMRDRQVFERRVR